MALTITGSLPWAMAENSGSGDWSARLLLASDRGAIATVEATGSGAAFLSLAWDAGAGVLALAPGAAADYDSLRDAGLDPVLSLSFRAILANGRVEEAPASFAITLLDRDDTPPQALEFASGGSVAAGAIGAAIGRLRVLDPDTPSDAPFAFTLPAEEEWRFAIDPDGVLRLREGISLGLDAMPVLPLLVGVSDGGQSAAFLLEIAVTDAEAPPPPDPRLSVGETRGALALPEAGRALVLRDAAALLDLSGGAGDRAILVAGEADAILPVSVRQIDFLDARLVLGGSQAALARALGGAEAASGLVALQGGAALVALAPLPAPAAPEAMLRHLHERILGQPPGEGELAWLLARLASGTSPEQLAVDLAAEAAAGAGPAWLAWSHGLAAPARDDALPAAVLAAAAMPEAGFDLLIG